MQERWLDWLVSDAAPGRRAAVLGRRGSSSSRRHRGALERRRAHRPIEANDEQLLGHARQGAHARARGRPRHPGAAARAGRATRASWPRAVEAVGYPCALKPRRGARVPPPLPRQGVRLPRPRPSSGLLPQTRGRRRRDARARRWCRGPDRYHSIVHLPRRARRATSCGRSPSRSCASTRSASAAASTTSWTGNPRCPSSACASAESVGLRGFLNVEFKRDERDGELKLIECNHRFTESTALHLAAGLNVPLFVYNHLLGLRRCRSRAAPTRSASRSGTRSTTSARSGTTARCGEMTLRAVHASLMRRQHFAMASLADPGPMVSSWVPRFKAVPRKVRKLLSRRRQEPESQPPAEADASSADSHEQLEKAASR